MFNSANSGFTGKESVTAQDFWTLSLLPRPTKTGAKAPLYTPPKSPPPNSGETAKPFPGRIYQKIHHPEPTKKKKTLEEYLTGSSFPIAPPGRKAFDPNHRAEVEDALTLFKNPQGLFNSQEVSQTAWKSDPWEYGVCEIDHPDKYHNNLSFPPFSSRTNHPARPHRPGVTDPYLYVSRPKRNIAFEFHVEDFELSSVNTSLWTDFDPDSMEVDDEDARPAAKIWIVVSALYRGAVEAGLEQPANELSSIQASFRKTSSALTRDPATKGTS
ncbi:hypothetical protein P7C70_g9182, partial [Phenoliferia sp. Uapishka_3]